MKTILLATIAGLSVRSIIGFFVRLGALGFFLLEALDSSFFYVPLANELLMLAHLREDEGALMWALFVLMSATGSATGSMLVDWPMRKAGEKGLEKFIKPARVKKIKARLKERAGWVLFVVGMFPPPFPFRPFVLTASALQTPRKVMLPAIFFGRLLRFGAEALLIFHFGRGLVKYMESDAFAYALYGFGAVAVAGTALTLYKWLGGSSKEKGKKKTKTKAKTKTKTA